MKEILKYFKELDRLFYFFALYIRNKLERKGGFGTEFFIHGSFKVKGLRGEEGTWWKG